MSNICYRKSFRFFLRCAAEFCRRLAVARPFAFRTLPARAANVGPCGPIRPYDTKPPALNRAQDVARERLLSEIPPRRWHVAGTPSIDGGVRDGFPNHGMFDGNEKLTDVVVLRYAVRAFVTVCFSGQRVCDIAGVRHASDSMIDPVPHEYLRLALQNLQAVVNQFSDCHRT